MSVRALFLYVPFLLVATAPFAGAQGLYTLDQNTGKIGFSVDNFGLFTADGMFRKFRSDLTIDTAHPERTMITVDVDAGSVDMPWDQGVTMLRSPDYFDVAHFPDVRFHSTGVLVLTPDHFRIDGALEIKHVTKPCVLDASLAGRHFDRALGADVVDFIVIGTLKRSDFGMVADQGFISDTVTLKITARLLLPDATHAN